MGIKRLATGMALAGIAGVGAAQPPAPAPASPPAATQPAPVPAPKPATVRVVLTTSAGPIVLALEKARAPVTTANFLRYVDARRFDGVAFYRAVKVAPGFGLVQGGIGQSGRPMFPPIAHEPTSVTGLSHGDGAVSMARLAPGSATADFFIVVGGFPTMDADRKAPGDNQGFAVFGHVVEGMDLVRGLLDAPRSADGPAAMKGEMLAAPVRIVTARRAPDEGAPAGPRPGAPKPEKLFSNRPTGIP